MAADVKWIKLAADIFDNRKIKQIESLPEGDAMIVIWLKLLILAGNVNDGGLVYFTKDIPYTEQLLATQFNRPLATVQLALRTFQSFGMISVVDDLIMVTNWEKYQNVDALNKVREQNRLRKARQRERERLLLAENTAMSRNSHVTVTGSHATEQDKEQDKDIKEQEEKPVVVGEFQLDPAEEQRIARDHSEILDAAEAAGFPKNSATYDKIIDLYAELGRDAVLAGISACVDQGNTKIAYLRACCRRIASGEKKADEDPLLPKDHVFMGW